MVNARARRWMSVFMLGFVLGEERAALRDDRVDILPSVVPRGVLDEGRCV